MKIAILGGSFDPPHLGHILIARQVLEFTDFAQVWLLPVASHAFDKKITSPEVRMKMVNLTGEKNILASDFEIKLGGMSKSINTLRKLSESRPKDTFSFIIGSDQLKDFYKWHEWENIVKEFGLIIFPREIHQKELKKMTMKFLNLKKIPKNVILMDSEDIILTNISSTKIRKKIKNQLSIEDLVNEKVASLIRKNKLYV